MNVLCLGSEVVGAELAATSSRASSLHGSTAASATWSG